MKQIVLATMVALLSTSAMAGWGSIGDAFDDVADHIEDNYNPENVGDSLDNLGDAIGDVAEGTGNVIIDPDTWDPEQNGTNDQFDKSTNCVEHINNPAGDTTQCSTFE